MIPLRMTGKSLTAQLRISLYYSSDSASSSLKSMAFTVSSAPLAFNAVFEHGQAVRTGGRHALDAGFKNFFNAPVIDALFRVLLHPHVAAAAAAAKAIRPAARQLNVFPVYGFQDFAGARHRYRYSAPGSRSRGRRLLCSGVFIDVQSSVFKQSGEKLGMVHDLVIAAELWILVFQAVEAVGAGGQYLFHVVPLENLDVLLAEGLEKVFVAHAAGGVAAAGLFIAQDGELNAGGLQDFSRGFSHLHVAVVEGGAAAHPVKNIDIFSVGHGIDVAVLRTRSSAWRWCRGRDGHACRGF